MKLSLLIALLLVAVASPGLAEVYQCRDADGSVRFTDRPCDDSSGLLSFPARDTADIDDARRDRTRKLLNAMRQERIEERERNAREQDERKQSIRKCAMARDRLAFLQRAGALYELDDSGERVLLSDAQRDEAIGRERQRVGKYCDGT